MPRKKSSGKFKLKTHKATAKRFRMTGKGKIVRTKGDKSHLRRHKSKRARRMFTQMQPVTAAGFRKRIRRLAPYMGKKS